MKSKDKQKAIIYEQGVTKILPFGYKGYFWDTMHRNNTDAQGLGQIVPPI